MLFKEQDSAFHCGHIMPKCRGGEDSIENLRHVPIAMHVWGANIGMNMKKI